MKTERRREAEALLDAIVAAANGDTPTQVGARLDQLRILEPFAMLNPELPGLLHILGDRWPGVGATSHAKAPSLPQEDVSEITRSAGPEIPIGPQNRNLEVGPVEAEPTPFV